MSMQEKLLNSSKMQSETIIKEKTEINRTNNRPKLNLPRYFEIYLTAFYAVIAVLFTLPTLFRITEIVPGEPGGDAWQMVWNLWWVKYALENFQYPLQTNMIFYPEGTDLYLHALNVWNGVVSLPVQYLFGGGVAGAIAGYNFIVWLALALSGLGAYKLALYLWQDWRGAVLAGLAFAFCTYHFDHLLGHLNLISSEFIPFYILYFLKTLHEKEKWRKNLALTVMFLIFNMLLELQYVVFLIIFTALYLIYISVAKLIERKSQAEVSLRQKWGRTVLIGVIFGLISLPFSIGVILEYLTNPNTVPLRQEKIYSADLLAYFYPSPFHPLWGEAMEKAVKPFTASLIEKIVFPTFTVYLLIILGLLVSLIGRKRESPKVPYSAGVWLYSGLSFVILSFGPVLHLNGKETGIPLPGAIIYELPLLNVTRVPSRFAVIAILALAMLAAWGFSRISLRFNKVWVQNAMMTGLAALLLFELLPVPYITTQTTTPQFYKNLANDPAKYAVLDLPVKPYETNYLEDQMTHRKPLLGGYISRNPVYPPYYGVPLFQEYRTFSTAPKPDFLPLQKLTPDILGFFGVRYIVVHKKLMDENQMNKILSLTYRLFPQGPVYNAENLEVFEVKTAPNSDIFFYNPVGFEWHEPEGNGANIARWAKGKEAKIDFWTSQPRKIMLDFSAWSFHEPHILQLALKQADGKILNFEKQEVGTDPRPIKLELELKPGQNQLIFKIEGKINRPSDFENVPDNRPLTIAVSYITLK
jgi:hypothetical protein